MSVPIFCYPSLFNLNVILTQIKKNLKERKIVILILRKPGSNVTAAFVCVFYLDALGLSLWYSAEEILIMIERNGPSS